MGVTPIDSLRGAPALTGGAVLASTRLSRMKAGWITFLETFKLALDALRAHKVRSFLTLLGVILAVTTLVAVMSVIEGLNVYVAEKVANLGSNVYIVDRFGIITSRDQFETIKKGAMENGMAADKILFYDNSKEIFNVMTTFCKEDDAILLEGRVPGLLVKKLEGLEV